MDVSDNTDDGGPVLDRAGPDAMTDGALARPFALGERLVDDNDVVSAIIGTGEVAAG